MRTLNMFGRDTLRSHDRRRRAVPPLETCGRKYVVRSRCVFHKLLYLYPEHLKLLYDRFKAANPKGVVIGPENSFDEYAPQEDRSGIEQAGEERKIFVDLFLTDEEQAIRMRENICRNCSNGMIDKMAPILG